MSGRNKNIPCNISIRYNQPVEYNPRDKYSGFYVSCVKEYCSEENFKDDTWIELLKVINLI